MNNLSLNYSSLGEGEPLLIIHGLFGSSRNWKSLSRQFAAHFNVLLVDLRNHGNSAFDSVMNYAVMVDDVIGLMDELGIQSAHILGHSMGGKVAMKLSHLHPQRVNKLVVADISPVRYSHNYREIFDSVLALDLSTVVNRNEADSQLEQTLADRRVRLFLLQNLSIQQGKARWTINWQALKQNMSIITGFEDISDWHIDTPCLVIRGEQSDYVKNENWALISRHFTNAELVTLKNAGHWLHAEQPEAFYEAVSLFLQAN